jgi:hypothetical protein
MTGIGQSPEGGTYVSTGELPRRERVQDLVVQAYEYFRSEQGGETSKAYPALAAVPDDLFGVCLVDTHGVEYGGWRLGALVHGHERFQAVCVRAGLRSDWT